ncbi:unnamed protein product [Effrenium voratum]|nr:unnamed protein product [Effrenium voratum]
MDSCAPQFLFAVCSAGADQDLKDAETELAKESGMNPMLVLKNIRNLKLYWQALGSDAESLHTRLGAMCDLMRSRITASYEQNEEKRPNLLKFSAAFDADTWQQRSEVLLAFYWKMAQRRGILVGVWQTSCKPSSSWFP